MYKDRLPDLLSFRGLVNRGSESMVFRISTGVKTGEKGRRDIRNSSGGYRSSFGGKTGLGVPEILEFVR